MIDVMPGTLADSELLARLVGFDSVSHKSNLPMADFLCDYLDDPKIEIVRNYNADRSKVNLVMRIRGQREEPESRDGLVLSGHMDVVPATEPEWAGDPFTLRETGEAFFGRGACDMKGFVALALNTFREAAVRSLKHPLVLILTFDEEPGMLGAEHLVKTWHKPFALPRACIVGEPTSLRVVRMHRGHLKMRVTFRGKTAHSGYPNLGVNAIEPLGPVIVALTELRESMKRERFESSRYFPETPYLALNLGRIHGGEAINVVPDRCVLEFGVRTLPETEPDVIAERCRTTIDSAAGSSDHAFEVIGYSPSLKVDESAEILLALGRLTGQPETFAVSYATDGGMLQRLGMDCAVWGPGTIEVAHKANEWMPKAEFVRARQVLSEVVQAFCE